MTWITEWADPAGIARTFHDTESAAEVAAGHRVAAGVRHVVVYEWDFDGEVA